MHSALPLIRVTQAACLKRLLPAGDAKAEPAAAKAGTSKKAAAAAAPAAPAAAEEQAEKEDGVKAKKAKRGVAVGDAIFDFELDTEEEGVRAKMSVSGSMQWCTLSAADAGVDCLVTS
jgi:hypothetical protein